MAYALIISIAAGVLLLALLALAGVLVSRRGPVSLRGWRWYPSPLGLLLLVPVAAFLLWRALPVLIFVPLVIPFFWRMRRGGGLPPLGRR
jgi:hypothetical protein